jgi:hypothetical protein
VLKNKTYLKMPQEVQDFLGHFLSDKKSLYSCILMPFDVDSK